MIIENRSTYHEVYKALHGAHKTAPETWDDAACNRVMKNLMGARQWSWRVTALTKAAIKQLHESGRKKGVQRAHIEPRIDTIRRIMMPNNPMAEEEFFDTWLRCDLAALGLQRENDLITRSEVETINIRNPNCELFTSLETSYVYAKLEKDLVKDLWEKHIRGSSTDEDRVIDIAR